MQNMQSMQNMKIMQNMQNMQDMQKMQNMQNMQNIFFIFCIYANAYMQWTPGSVVSLAMFSLNFGHFSLVKSSKNEIAFLMQKGCSNKESEENKSGFECPLPKGSKKNQFFLGNSPKQRTPPTHPYGLGLT